MPKAASASAATGAGRSRIASARYPRTALEHRRAAAAGKPEAGANGRALPAVPVA